MRDTGIEIASKPAGKWAVAAGAAVAADKAVEPACLAANNCDCFEEPEDETAFKAKQAECPNGFRFPIRNSEGKVLPSRGYGKTSYGCSGQCHGPVPLPVRCTNGIATHNIIFIDMTH